MKTLMIEVAPGHFVNLSAAVEIEQDPEDASVVMLTLPGTGYEPATPLLVALTGEAAALALAYGRMQAAAARALLLSEVI